MDEYYNFAASGFSLSGSTVINILIIENLKMRIFLFIVISTLVAA